MTAKELQTIENELQKRGYKKWTTGLTSTETYAWFKAFDKEKDDDDYVISGYQIAFRVWDSRKYVDRNAPPYGFDFWTSPLGTAFAPTSPQIGSRYATSTPSSVWRRNLIRW